MCVTGILFPSAHHSLVPSMYSALDILVHVDVALFLSASLSVTLGSVACLHRTLLNACVHHYVLLFQASS